MNTFTRVLFSLLVVPTQQHHYYLLPPTPLRLFLFNVSLMVNLQVPIPAVLTVVLVAHFVVVGGTTPITVATIISVGMVMLSESIIILVSIK